MESLSKVYVHPGSRVYHVVRRPGWMGYRSGLLCDGWARVHRMVTLRESTAVLDFVPCGKCFGSKPQAFKRREAILRTLDADSNEAV